MAAVIGSMLKRKDINRKALQKQRMNLDRDYLMPHVANITIKPFPMYPPKWLSGKDAEEAIKLQAAHETIKKMLHGKELLRQKSKASFDALSQVSYQDNEGDEASKFKNGDSAIYIGLILICIGVVITFVGLGEKGFKTIQLKVIGPTLCIVGLAMVLLKIMQCAFPQLFQFPSCFRRKKLGDKERTVNQMEKGTPTSYGNKHIKMQRKSEINEGESEEKVQKEKQNQIPSPRVTLHSSKKAVNPNPTARPRSTIPNYIEASSDDDDFDPKGKWKPSEKNLSRNSPPKETSQPQEVLQDVSPLKESTTTPPPIKTPPATDSEESNKKSDEIVLNPRGLLL